MTVKIVRPQIKGGILCALEMFADERSNEVHKVTPTQLVNDFVFEEWLDEPIDKTGEML